MLLQIYGPGPAGDLYLIKKGKPGYDYSGHLPKPTTVTLLVTVNYSKLKDGADAVTR
jgi:hypothetical protein